MGRPMRTAKAVDGTTKTGPTGAEGVAGQQIQFIARVTGGTSNNTTVVTQKGTNRFECTTSDGTSIVSLVALGTGAISVGEASLTATDSTSKTYYVTKLTTNRATLTQFGAGTHEFDTGSSAVWVDGTATPVLNVSVSLVTA